MRYQIRDDAGNIVDQNLSYDEALLWVDQSFGGHFTMEPMKGD